MAEHATMIACRLPDALIADAKRYAALYHSDLSKLLREGLTYRLALKSWPPIPPRDMPSSAMPPHVTHLLQALATYLDQVRQELTDVGTSHGQSPTTAPGMSNGITMPVESLNASPRLPEPAPVDTHDTSNGPYADDLEDMPLQPEPANGVAPPGYYFGTPCKAHGHVSHGYTPRGEPQNLRGPGGKCVLCEEQKKTTAKAQRQALGTQET